MKGDNDPKGLQQNKILQIKDRIFKALERSTFHGIDIIMEAPIGYKRITMILFVVLMSVFAAAGSIYSLIGFLNFPYKTLVNYEQKSFTFPEVTICPFSPFTESMLNAAPKAAKMNHQKILDFWTKSLSPDESNVMKYLKRSFTSLYYQHSKYLRKDWNSIFLSCYYNGENCLKDIVAIEHPMAYQCFQISLNLTPTAGTRSGYARGLQLVLFRNYKSDPLLMLNEFYDPIYSAFKHGSDGIEKFDGVLVVIHSKNEMPSYKLTASPNNYPIVFGNRISITLKEKFYKQTKTVLRPCSNSPVFYKLMKLTDFFMSRSIENQKKFLSLNLGNCASRYRQKLISHTCKCFTEYEMIPFDDSNEFKSKGFCHDVDWFGSKSEEKILNNINCSQIIDLMSDLEILKRFSKSDELAKLNIGKGKCTVACDRTILGLKRVQTDEILYRLNLNLFPDYFKTILNQNLQSPFDLEKLNTTILQPGDLIAIDIHAEEERIPILDEDLDKNFSNFVAEIGGVFGLFLGFSGVTAFEIIECLILLLTIMFIMFRTRFTKDKKNKVKKKKSKSVKKDK